MKTSNKNSETKSFFIVSKGITAKWMFSPGHLVRTEEQVDDDFCWDATISTVPLDYDDDSSIMYEDEFAEDLVDDVTEIGQAPDDDASMNEKENVSPPTPPEENEMLQRFYKEFKEMSLSPSHEQKRRRSYYVVCPVRLTSSARRSSTGSKKYNQRLTQSEHNRDLIRESLKSLLD